MTNLARFNGEYALFAGETDGQKRPNPIGADEFYRLFDLRNGHLNSKPPYDALSEIWASHVAPHLEAPSTASASSQQEVSEK